MVKDRSQCEKCIYSYWGEGKKDGSRRFFWCNHLDKTGESHVVVDGVCKSRKTKRDKVDTVSGGKKK